MRPTFHAALFVSTLAVFGCSKEASRHPIVGDDAGGGMDAGATDASRDMAFHVDTGVCTTDGDCENDSHCVMGTCVGWGPGETNAMCVRAISSGPVKPLVQCSWPSASMDDDGGIPVPTSISTDQTPVVATLGITTNIDTTPRPSIVFITDDEYMERVATGCSSRGILRVMDGATCELQASMTNDDDRVVGQVSPAIGDLDGDGVAEIVAVRALGGMIAFHWDAASNQLVRAWVSHTMDGMEEHNGLECRWGSITIADLDGNPGAEIIFGKYIFDQNGLYLGQIPGYDESLNASHLGAPVVVADVDLDGKAEVVTGQGVYTWNAGSHALELESYWDANTSGYVAVADFGDFPDVAGDAPGHPELVFVTGGHVILTTIVGSEIMNITSPSTSLNHGGPPTIADFNADGRPEIGVAFGNDYAVFDPHTMSELWETASQDLSSAQTGSSVFDFNADGRSEVVYGDECYIRIYDGPTGHVLFSQPRFSATWNENPIIADVDRDNAAEIVAVAGYAGSPASACDDTVARGSYCPAYDPVFHGLACATGTDCPSGNCVGGLCRCMSDADCGGSYACTNALAGESDGGQVCRSHFTSCNLGITVYRDGRDGWAPSRDTWNQHAYSITNINDDLTIPTASSMVNNWQMSGYNNFRENVQTTPSLVAADLTVRNLAAVCDGDNTIISADVCNRGEAFTDLGVKIVFSQVGAASILCDLRTTQPIGGGQCTNVHCEAMVKAQGDFRGVVDPDGRIAECEESNNVGLGHANCLL